MDAMVVRDRRRDPRTELASGCTLQRRTGTPIACETVDVGAGGMSVCSRRPLAPDEVVTFELEIAAVAGRARVLRQHGHDCYSLRFEELADAARVELARLIDR
jgi:c-di-GMP-binding flagellar brake protein YcgR